MRRKSTFAGVWICLLLVMAAWCGSAHADPGPWSDWVALNDGAHNLLKMSFRRLTPNPQSFSEYINVRYFNGYNVSIYVETNFDVVNKTDGSVETGKSWGNELKPGQTLEDGAPYAIPGKNAQTTAYSVNNVRIIELDMALPSDPTGTKYEVYPVNKLAQMQQQQQADAAAKQKQADDDARRKQEDAQKQQQQEQQRKNDAEKQRQQDELHRQANQAVQNARDAAQAQVNAAQAATDAETHREQAQAALKNQSSGRQADDTPEIKRMLREKKDALEQAVDDDAQAESFDGQANAGFGGPAGVAIARAGAQMFRNKAQDQRDEADKLDRKIEQAREDLANQPVDDGQGDAMPQVSGNRNFWFNYTFEPKGARQWSQVDANNWTERYPDGTLTQFHYISHAEVEGVPGIIVSRLPDEPFEVFIPDAENTVENGKWLRFRADSTQNWSYLAEMQAGMVPDAAQPTPTTKINPVDGTDGAGAGAAADMAAEMAAPRQTKINPIDGAEMIFIPAGKFIMGYYVATTSIGQAKPAHTVYLDGYWIYKNDVTVGQYKKFCKATRHKMPRVLHQDWDWIDTHPIINVTVKDALAYCQWAGVKLPTEAQWEKAARGVDGRSFPWGNENDETKSWVNKSNAPAPSTVPVGSFPEDTSPFGCTDMEGNVRNWCSKYNEASPDSNPIGSILGPEYSTRGGSWESDYLSPVASSWGNSTIDADDYDIDLGFRCSADN